MTTIELFKNLWYDDKRRLPLFSSITAQNTYFNSLPYTNKTTFSEANFNKVGDPMLLSLAFDEALDYKSGRFLFGSKWFYFQIVNLEVNTNTRTRIIYKIDTWLTTRYQYNTTFGVGHISRRNDFSGRPKQPHTPISMTATSTVLYGTNKNEDIIFSYTNANGGVEYGYYPMGLGMAELNFLVTDCGIQADSIRGCWVTPLGFNNETLLTHWTSHTAESGNPWYSCGSSAFMPKLTLSLPSNFKTNEMQMCGFADSRGNIVATMPYDKQISSITAKLRVSLTSAMWELTTNIMNPSGDLIGIHATIPCEPIDYIIDSWELYASTQRQIDIETRQIQSKQALVNGISGAGNSALWGGIAGSASGAGPAGAVAGLGLSLMGSVASYLSDEYYAPKLQALTDRQYQFAQDAMVLIGSSIGQCYTTLDLDRGCNAYAFILTADTYSINRMNDDLSIAGCYVDEVVSNIEPYIGNGKILQADVEVLGNIPSNWKADLQQRIANGVTMELIL